MEEGGGGIGFPGIFSSIPGPRLGCNAAYMQGYSVS